MCLGLPGQVVEVGHKHPDLAVVDVDGVRRPINIGMLAETALAPGDWVLTHMGFALSVMAPDEVSAALDFLGGSSGDAESPGSAPSPWAEGVA